jgi:hypothetical protein
VRTGVPVVRVGEHTVVANSELTALRARVKRSTVSGSVGVTTVMGLLGRKAARSGLSATMAA